MRSIAAIIALCIFCSACADKDERVNAWYEQRKAQCLQEPFTRSNVVRETDCVSNALIEANTARRSPLISDANEFVSVQHETATAYSEGKISQDEFFYQYNSAKARYNQAAIQYDQQNQETRDNQNMQMLLYLNQSVTPTQPATTATCNSYRIAGAIQTNCY